MSHDDFRLGFDGIGTSLIESSLQKGLAMRHREWALATVKPDMTPMIDCVFQLMIFFMLTLKFVQAEGNFDINMPARGAPGGDIGLDIKR